MISADAGSEVALWLPVQANIEALQQGVAVLQHISPEAYRYAAVEVFGSTIGQHVRHNIDHYTLFFDGLDEGLIDYDARRRSADVERCPQSAIAEIAGLCELLARLVGRPPTLPLAVRCDAREELAPTSLRRELDFLLSHTVHHYALVSVLCRLQGLDVAAEFGVARSTVRFRASLREAPR